ncbi:MAG: conjugal transfer protein TraH [Succinivibrio sp.]|nr:conjugal transfer protein TraH [Succinivibrio sp.]
MKYERNKMLKLSKIATATIICTKHTLLGVSLFTLLTAPVTVAHAGFLSDAMDLKANIMSNTTNPQSYQSASRHVFAGGGIVAKNKIFSSDVISFTPPSFTSGCGGINMYLGSFSFINKDQIVTLFRSIAQNAIGYLFKIALKALSEMISSTIEEFQNIVQKLNEFLGNSCQIAQGLVDGGIDALMGKEDQKQGNWARLKGEAQDAWAGIKGLFGAKSDAKAEEVTEPGLGGTKMVVTSKDGKEKAEDKYPTSGNITYKALQTISVNSAIGSQTAYSNKVKDFKLDQIGEIMALTGIVIIKKENETRQSHNGNGISEEASQTDTTLTFDVRHPLISLKDLVEYDSNALDVYKCAGDNCDDPKLEENGGGKKGYLQHQLMQKFCGTEYDKVPGQTNCTGGLIQALVAPDGATNASTVENGLEGLPEGMKRMTYALAEAAKKATKNDYAANGVGETLRGHISCIATEIAFETAMKTITNVRDGLMNLQLEPERTDAAFKLLQFVENNVRDDYRVLQSRYGKIDDLEKMMRIQVDAMSSKGAINGALFN